MNDDDWLEHAADLAEEARRRRIEAAHQSSAARQAHADATRERLQVQNHRQRLLDVLPPEPSGGGPGLLLFHPGFAQVDDPDRIAAALLDAALTLTRAPMGNVQLIHPATGQLRIVAQRGFDHAFLDHFALVGGREAACGTALAEARPVRVRDVEAGGPFDADGRARVLAAGVRSVQSVPLPARNNTVLGVLSVHHRVPREPGPAEREMLTTLAAAGARRLQRRLA